MSLIIETTDDFIRALRGNEEFKAAARRELLTQDLLELPKEFRESAGILKKMFGQDAIAAVYGFSIESEQVEQARSTDDLAEVHVFLETESL